MGTDRPHVCVIAGDGPERPALERRAAALGIAGHVRFAGFRHNLAPFYSMADLFVLPSRSEGSPNVLLEAMAAGLPIVASDVGGVSEIAAHAQTALLYEDDDVGALFRRIAQILADPGEARALGAAAREASQRYSPESYRRDLISVYASVLGLPA